MIGFARPLTSLAVLTLALSTGTAQALQVLLSVDTRANRIVTLNPQDGSVLNGLFVLDANNAAGGLSKLRVGPKGSILGSFSTIAAPGGSRSATRPGT